MDVEGEYQFAAGREAVFDALVDPEALKRALPGCEDFREVSPEHYRVVMALNVIAFSVTVSGDVAITDRVRPESYRVEVFGSGSAGSLRVNGRFVLGDEGPRSRLRYQLTIETTGTLGMLGAPIIEPAAKLILGQFFGAMANQVGRG